MQDVDAAWAAGVIAVIGAIVATVLKALPFMSQQFAKVVEAYTNAKVRELNQRATEAPPEVDPEEHARKAVTAPESLKSTWKRPHKDG